MLLTAFILIELRASAPLVRLNIFRVRSLTAANVVMFLVASGLFAMFFFNSLYLQKVLDYGPLKAGLAFLPFTAGIMVSAGLASQFAPRIGVRPVAVVGMLVTMVGLLLLARIPVHGSYVADVMPSILLTSLGMGAVFVPLTLVATTGLEDSDQGLASGLFNTSQQIGGALGLAVLSTLAASRSGGTRKASLVHGFHWAFAGGAGFVLAGARAARRAPAPARRRADSGGCDPSGRGAGRIALPVTWFACASHPVRRARCTSAAL